MTLTQNEVWELRLMSSNVAREERPKKHAAKRKTTLEVSLQSARISCRSLTSLVSLWEKIKTSVHDGEQV